MGDEIEEIELQTTAKTDCGDPEGRWNEVNAVWYVRQDMRDFIWTSWIARWRFVAPRRHFVLAQLPKPLDWRSTEEGHRTDDNDRLFALETMIHLIAIGVGPAAAESIATMGLSTKGTFKTLK